MPADTYITRQALEHRFSYHPPQNNATRLAHEQVRDVCLEAADKVVELTGGSSPEQSLAIRKFEEAMFWANAAIARNPPTG